MPMTVAPRAFSLMAVARPMLPRPTSRMRCWLIRPISQRPVHSVFCCCASNRGRLFAPASRPKTAYSASGSAWTPAEVLNATRARSASERPAALTCAPPPAGMVCTQRRPALASDGAGQRRGLLVRHAVERLGGVDQLLERGLLRRRPLKGRIPGMVAGEALRRKQALVADEVDARFGPHDLGDQVLADRGRCHHTEASRS